MFSETLRSLAGARTADDIAGLRVSIVDAVEAGTIAADAGAALQAVARLIHADIAANGPRPVKATPKATQATTDDRLPAVIQEAADAEYPESGPIIRGIVAVQIDGAEQLVKFRIKREWTGSVKALFGAAGVPDDADATQLVGAAVQVTMGTYESQNGTMPVVKKWHRPVAAKAAPAKPAAPEWDAEEAASPRAPRRTAAAKIRAEVRETNPDDDGMFF